MPTQFPPPGGPQSPQQQGPDKPGSGPGFFTWPRLRAILPIVAVIVGVLIAVATSRDSLGSADVGDCLTSRDSKSANVVACSDGSARYEVVNIVRMSSSDFNTTGGSTRAAMRPPACSGSARETPDAPTACERPDRRTRPPVPLPAG